MAAVVSVGFAVSRMLTPAALPMVSVRSAQVGNIEQSVDASGTVTTEESKTYFSPVGERYPSVRCRREMQWQQEM